jgi:hypothetical protein
MTKITLIALCALLAVPGVGGVAAAPSREILKVSLPQFRVQDDESVGTVKCKVTGGSIITVSRVPEMWSLTIINGDGGISTLTAKALVGAAEFRNADLGYFTNFLEIERPNPPGPYDRPFEVTVSLVLVSNAKGAPERRLRFSQKDLVLSINREGHRSSW